MLAFEVAQQLRKQGDQVALLVLLTPSRLIHDVGAFDSMKKDASLPKEISRHLQKVAELSPRERLNYVLRRTKAKTRHLPKAVTYPIRKRVENLLCKIYLRLGWLLASFASKPLYPPGVLQSDGRLSTRSLSRPRHHLQIYAHVESHHSRRHGSP